MAAETSPERYDDTDGYAVAVIRGETAWTVHLLDPGALGSIAKAEQELKALRATGAVIGLLNVDDEYFVIVRPGPSGTRLLLSDATAAVFDELAVQALDRLDVDVPGGRVAVTRAGTAAAPVPLPRGPAADRPGGTGGHR